MITKKFNQFLLAGLLLGLSGNAAAIAIPPGFEGVVAPDIRGSGVFRPAFRQTLNIEVFDLLDNVAPPANSEFGFYFARGFDPSDPDSLIPIFGADDLSSDSTFVIGEQAVVDFFNGFVADVEDNSIEQTFTPRGRDDIGFYWKQTGGLTLFSQPNLNPSGADTSGEFRYLSDPMTWAIVFGLPLGNGVTSLLGINVVDGLVPSAIPLPGAAGLWLLGLAGIALFRRRISRSSA